MLIKHNKRDKLLRFIGDKEVLVMFNQNLNTYMLSLIVIEGIEIIR